MKFHPRGSRRTFQQSAGKKKCWKEPPALLCWHHRQQSPALPPTTPQMLQAACGCQLQLQPHHLRSMKSKTKSHNLQGTPITVGARHLTSENPMRTVLQCCTQFRTDTCDVPGFFQNLCIAVGSDSKGEGLWLARHICYRRWNEGLSDFFDCIGEFSPVFSHCFTAMPLSQPEEANSPGFIKRHCNYSFLVLI